MNSILQILIFIIIPLILIRSTIGVVSNLLKIRLAKGARKINNKYFLYRTDKEWGELNQYIDWISAIEEHYLIYLHIKSLIMNRKDLKKIKEKALTEKHEQLDEVVEECIKKIDLQLTDYITKYPETTWVDIKLKNDVVTELSNPDKVEFATENLLKVSTSIQLKLVNDYDWDTKDISETVNVSSNEITLSFRS